ncbi:MAG: MMPL family transporter, partial [Woeseiaceae bacterium]|nr:MMPL family transporter [Woeseiaceae bacterium]
TTAIPAIVLVIGVADAVHMHAAWLEARRRLAAREAVDRMLAATGRACWYTTLTTVAGFSSLLVAGLESVRQFGLIAAIGIAAAYIANQAILPGISRNLRWHAPARCGRWTACLERRVLTLIAVSLRHPRTTVALFLLPIALSLAALPQVIIDQRFNEELPRDDPVRVAQQQLEEAFGGFLGPELSLRRVDGDSWAERRHLADLRCFADRLGELAGVERIESILDWLPADDRQWVASLDALERDAALSARLRERINADRTWLSISLRTRDIGTRAATELAAGASRLAEEAFGGRVESRVVGQWWIAQQGMSRLLQDMLASLLTATAIIAPMLWLLFRRLRLFLAALMTNIVPVIAAIGFMAASGISLRIGTAVVLAVALGLAVDNTAHVGDWLTAGGRHGRLRRSTPLAVLITTLGLIAGFASMIGNELLVLRDMGLVAVVAFVAAFAADLLLLPALFALSGGTAERPALRVA